MHTAKSGRVIDEVIAGVVFSFAAFLTSRRKRIMLSATDNAAPAADAAVEFLRSEGIRLSEDIHKWRDTRDAIITIGEL